MFKVRMQGQYGAKTDKRLSAVIGEMWSQYGFRHGIMRGFWVSALVSIYRDLGSLMLFTRSPLPGKYPHMQGGLF